MQLSEIQQQIRDITDEESTLDPTDAQLLPFINYRYQDLVGKITNLYEKYFITSASQNTVEDQELYDLPQDSNSRPEVKRITRVEISYDGTNWNRAKYTNRNDISRTEDNTGVSHTQGYPYYFLEGNTLGFDPIPDADGTNKIKIWYIERQADLSAASDKPNIPDDYHRLIVYGAAADLKKRDDDFGAAQNYENDYLSGVKNMLEEMSRRDISGVDEVEDTGDTQSLNNETYVSNSSLS